MIIRLADAVSSDISTARLLSSGQGAKRFAERYLMTYDIKTSADDVVTLKILSKNGSEMESITTSAATSGEFGGFTGYWQLSGEETFTLTGIGSGTATVDIVITD